MNKIQELREQMMKLKEENDRLKGRKQELEYLNQATDLDILTISSLQETISDLERERECLQEEIKNLS